MQWAVPPALNLALLVSLARLNDKALAAIIFFSYVRGLHHQVIVAHPVFFSSGQTACIFFLPLWMTAYLAFLFPSGSAPEGATCASP